jgi:hypothetical protein
MATRSILNNGTVANDGTGDTLRDAAVKINNNFANVWRVLGSSDSYLSQNISFDSAGAIVFEGTNNYVTKLVAEDATSENYVITLPAASGTVVLKDTVDVLENKTLLHPVVDDIHDSDGDILVAFSSNGTLPNHLVLANGDSDNGVSLTIGGDSGDVDLILSGLNDGIVRVNGRVVLDNETIVNHEARASITKATTLLNKSSTPFRVYLDDGIDIGDVKRFVNINVAKCYLEPVNFANGAQIDVLQNAVVSLIWTGNNWHLSSDTGVTVQSVVGAS